VFFAFSVANNSQNPMGHSAPMSLKKSRILGTEFPEAINRAECFHTHSPARCYLYL